MQATGGGFHPEMVSADPALDGGDSCEAWGFGGALKGASELNYCSCSLSLTPKLLLPKWRAFTTLQSASIGIAYKLAEHRKQKV